MCGHKGNLERGRKKKKVLVELSPEHSSESVISWNKVFPSLESISLIDFLIFFWLTIVLLWILPHVLHNHGERPKWFLWMWFFPESNSLLFTRLIFRYVRWKDRAAHCQAFGIYGCPWAQLGLCWPLNLLRNHLHPCWHCRYGNMRIGAL